MKLALETPVINLHRYGIARLSPTMSRKLAAALAPFASKTDVDEVTVEDLLNYFPARYEDRSNMLPLDELAAGMEAAVELTVRNAGGMQVGKNRDRRRPALFIYEITAGDAERRFRPVLIKWFISGRNAKQILAAANQIHAFTELVILADSGHENVDGAQEDYNRRCAAD